MGVPTKLQVPSEKAPAKFGGKHNSGQGRRALAGFSYGPTGSESFDPVTSHSGGSGKTASGFSVGPKGKETAIGPTVH